MGFLRHLPLLTICMFILLTTNKTMSQPIDSIDMCILTCDRCFKDDSLLNCANHCIFSGGTMDHAWKITCPLFDDTPHVQQI